MRPSPELVESFPAAGDVSADPFTVSLRLREASWSDGVAITAGDVRFSWERLREGPTGYRYRFLRDVEITGERTFRLRFDRPVRRWWSLFSLDDMVLPAHAYTADWASGPTVSGGPFRLAVWEEGLRVRLVRNDRYWGPGARVGGVDALFVPDDETRLQLLDSGELDAAFFEGDVNIGRRARARGLEPTGEALVDGGASGAWGPTWWELDLDAGRLGAGVAAAVSSALDPALAAEILEDSGQVMNGIPARFPVPGAEGDGLPAIDGPWAGRGGGATTAAQVRLTHPRGTGGALARWAYFRLRDRGITAELVGLDADAFERHLDGADRAPAILRLRRGADASDAGSYAGVSGEPGASGTADADVAGAETATTAASNEPGVGLSERAWSGAQERLAASATAAPLARVRTWIVGRRGVGGPRATGASPGPLWNAGEWTMRP